MFTRLRINCAGVALRKNRRHRLYDLVLEQTRIQLIYTYFFLNRPQLFTQQSGRIRTYSLIHDSLSKKGNKDPLVYLC